MPGGASPRRKGDYFERQTKRDLEARGWLVVRAAGSLGPCDLVAISTGQQPLLISCKLGGRIGPDERSMLTVIANRYGAAAILASRPRPGVVDYQPIGDHDADPAPRRK